MAGIEAEVQESPFLSTMYVYVTHILHKIVYRISIMLNDIKSWLVINYTTNRVTLKMHKEGQRLPFQRLPLIQVCVELYINTRNVFTRHFSISLQTIRESWPSGSVLSFHT